MPFCVYIINVCGKENLPQTRMYIILRNIYVMSYKTNSYKSNSLHLSIISMHVVSSPFTSIHGALDIAKHA